MPKGNKTEERKIDGAEFHRTFEIECTRADEEGSREVGLAFSSEAGYERWFGEEVLDHNPQSVRLDRLNGDAAVLVNHDPNDQVGVVESATIDDDKRGRATVRFSRSARGQEILQDVQDGIRKLVSVGYRILDYETTEREGMSDLVRVTDWEPYEISLVSIPADASVGVGRSAEETKPVIESKTDTLEEKSMSKEETPKSVEAPAINTKEIESKTRSDELARINAIRELGETHDLDQASREAINDGVSVSDFQKHVLGVVGERNNKARLNETEAVDVDLTAREVQDFSMFRLMDALGNPTDRKAQERAAFELEVSAAAEAKMPSGYKARGAFVPDSVWTQQRTLTAGTATDGAELVGTDHQASSFIEMLYNNSTALEAGAMRLPGLVGDQSIPRRTAGATAAFVSAENANAANSETQFDNVTMTPKDMAFYVDVSRRLTQQGTPAIEGLIRSDAAVAFGLGIDNAVFYGSGSSGQPQGIDGATGVDDPTITAGAPTYAQMRAQMKDMIAANAANNLTYIISPDTWDVLGSTPKQGSGVEGNFILNEDRNTILGRPYVVSTQLAADDFVLGNFSDVLLGEWSGVEINVDTATLSLAGATRFVFFKTCDIALRHGASFSFHNNA